MTSLQTRTLARYVVIEARARGVEEHEIEAWATDARIAEVAGCDEVPAPQAVRDAIGFIVA